ncbi:uncharacterized protein LOC144084996 [Stigmatopora argus]
MDPMSDPFGLKSLVDCIFRAIYFSEPTDMSDFIHQYISDLMDYIGFHEEVSLKRLFVVFQEQWEKKFLDIKVTKSCMDSVPSLQNLSEAEIEDLLHKLYKDLAIANVLPKEVVHRTKRGRKHSKKSNDEVKCGVSSSPEALDEVNTEPDVVSAGWTSCEEDNLQQCDEAIPALKPCELPPILVTSSNMEKTTLTNVNISPEPLSDVLVLQSRSQTQELDLARSPSREELVLMPSPTRHESFLTPSPTRQELFPTPSPTRQEFFPTPSPTRQESFLTPSPTRQESFLTPSPTRQESFLTPSPTRQESFLTPSPTRQESFLTPSPTREESFLTPSPRQDSFLTPSPRQESFLSPSPQREEPDFTPSPHRQESVFTPSPPRMDSYFTPSPQQKESLFSPSPPRQRFSSPPSPPRKIKFVNKSELTVHMKGSDETISKSSGQNLAQTRNDATPGTDKAKCVNRGTLLGADKTKTVSFGAKKTSSDTRPKRVDSKNTRPPYIIAQKQGPSKSEPVTRPPQEAKKNRLGSSQSSGSKKFERSQSLNRLTILETTNVLAHVTMSPKRQKSGVKSSLPEVKRTRLSLRHLYGAERPKSGGADTSPKPKQPWKNPLSDPPRREGPPRVLWMDRERVKPVQNRTHWKIPARILF